MHEDIKKVKVKNDKEMDKLLKKDKILDKKMDKCEKKMKKSS